MDKNTRNIITQVKVLLSAIDQAREGSVKLTPKKYAKEGGSRCPMCLSHDIEYSASHGMDSNCTFWHVIVCHACNHQWLDIFTLSGYDSLEKIG